MKRFGTRKFARYGGAAAVLGTVAVVVAIAATTALAVPSTKLYVTGFDPQFAKPGTTRSYTLTLTNCGVGITGCARASNQSLGSANYAIPAEYQGNVTIGTVSSPTGGWTVTLSSDNSTLQFRSATSKDGLPAGSFVSVVLTITAPATAAAAFCPSADWVWDSHVKQSNDFSGTGNDFARASGTSDASLTAAKLVFVTAGSPPAEVVLGNTFPAAVTAEDLCGTALGAAAQGTPVTLGLDDPAQASGTLSGASLPSQNVGQTGVATFAGLSIDKVGTLYDLNASSTNFASGTSNTITIVNVLCQAHQKCSQSSDDTLITATAQTPTGGEVGIGFTGVGTYTAPFICGASTTPIDGQLVVVDPSPDAYGGNYTVTLLYDKSVTGTGPASSFPVCISKDGTTRPSPPNPLKACAAPPPVGPPPCVASEKRTSNGALQVILLLAPGDPVPGTGH